VSTILSPPEPPQAEHQNDFSIGICAADRATNLAKLLTAITREQFPEGYTLRKIILVASGCDPNALAYARELAASDERFKILEEPQRYGKSEAINKIIDSFEGSFLVLVNSDASPESGAIFKLLRSMEEDASAGMVSASPVIAPRHGITHCVVRLMWAAHNQCLEELTRIEKNNHCCDELLIIRSEALQKLPPDTVNDGAFLAVNSTRAGYSVKFSESAKVNIDVPQRMVDVIEQRRRILFGHRQIWESVGQPPRTLESMLMTNPVLSISILIKTLARSPELVTALPVAIVSEAVSTFLAVLDTLTSTKRHKLWTRFGNKS
jgi:cellulose synthase/poly-beta-1,6-N-acetylglucosamine synthase-like glycosyltransferase